MTKHNASNFDALRLNALFYSPKIAVNSGLNVQKLEHKIITFDDFLDLTEEDIGTAEMDDYLIEAFANLDNLKNE